MINCHKKSLNFFENPPTLVSSMRNILDDIHYMDRFLNDAILEYIFKIEHFQFFQTSKLHT